MNMKVKIICTGIMKTGTVSLTEALRILGWRIEHYPTDPMTNWECLSMGYGPISAMERSDGVSDLQAAIYWPELLKAYPDALIVHTTRYNDTWAPSMQRHCRRFPPKDVPMDLHSEYRLAAFGCANFKRERMLRAKHRLDRSILSGELSAWGVCHIPLELGGQFKWERLVSFLRGHGYPDLQVPAKQWPHLNATPEDAL